MAKVGRTIPNTIAKAPITFAMIELADSADCNARKSQWLRYGFTDVTPIFAGRSTVPSLNGVTVAQGRQMLKAMATVEADWYMVSGHHGALYASDYKNFETNGAFETLDAGALYNGEEFCGFFNEAYHQGRWENASRANPDRKADPNEIYLRTTAAAPGAIAKHEQDNPVFDSTSVGSAPKGIILSACNTLAYRSARQTWSSLFPNSLIIGPFSWIVHGYWVTNAIAAAQMTDESFWRDPQSILDKPGMPEQLEHQLSASFPKSSEIALIYKGTLHRNDGSSQPAGDPS